MYCVHLYGYIYGAKVQGCRITHTHTAQLFPGNKTDFSSKNSGYINHPFIQFDFFKTNSSMKGLLRSNLGKYKTQPNYSQELSATLTK